MPAAQLPVPAATAKGPIDRDSPELLALRAVHERLQCCLDALATIISRPACSNIELTSARFRISQASLDREFLFKKIVAALSVDKQNSADLELLVRADRELMIHCSSHISSWTAEAAAKDWPRYSAASRDLYQHICSAIRQEASVLYPMMRKGT